MQLISQYASKQISQYASTQQELAIWIFNVLPHLTDLKGDIEKSIRQNVSWMLNLQGVDIIHLWHKIHLSSRYIIGLATEQNTSQITLISILSSSLFLDIPSSNPAQHFYPNIFISDNLLFSNITMALPSDK